ncbi:helix-turn-helix transcriptional regulator [Neisseria elongata]|jgi:bacteriophage CI repressor helix-turn-helix domain|uniref:helix-turn-helix transcriptional regulator n=1 Tax=Neisseria elongata TaxID=495 RepID=UPI00195E3FCF|nr:helix-turn-helix transcriptional regulator [Neisseria elongata]MBM7065261.1 helix-turn-helix transcriptional regulator [Neisseria elongata]
MNRVRQFRKQKRLSQQELAQLVEVSRQTINLIENQDYNPTLALCIRIAKALDVDLNKLFWEQENEQIEPSSD